MESSAGQDRNTRVLSRISYLWYVPVTVAALGLLLYSCCKSIEYTLYDELDRQITVGENVPLLVVGVILSLLFIKVWMDRLAPKLPATIYPFLPLIVCAVISLWLIFSVRGLAVNDALTMDGITNRFMQGDYSDFTMPGGYLYSKSHQIGYLVYETVMYRLFGASNFRAYQLVNLLGILVTVYLLARIARELFEDELTFQLTCLLSCGMLYLFVYSTHVYNDIPSLPLQEAAMYLQLRYLRTGKIRYELTAGITLALGYMIKTNVLISLVAMIIMLLLETLRRLRSDEPASGKLQPVFFAVYLTVLCLGLMNVVRGYYTRLAGIDTFPPGEPMSTYVAMSLQETDEGQSGWYNGYNARVFAENGFDYEQTDAVARADIKRRMSELMQDPSHMAYLFAKKFLTQWGDASCISMRNLELTSRHVEGHSALTDSVLYGRGRTVFYQIMNVFQTVCFLGFMIYCIDALRRHVFPAAQSFLILYIFGGMLFHEFWEASSRYTMRYYVFFVPFAAYGITRLLSLLPGASAKGGSAV